MSSEQSGAESGAPRRKRWPRILGAVLAILVVIQFLPSGRSNPAVSVDMPAPVEIKNLLRKACYDCHSNQSEWPWYSKIAPLSWWIVHHVDEGRAELNFSTWDAYSKEERAHLLHECAEEMSSGEMPLPSYTWMHAGLSENERDRLLAWLRTGAKRD